jgi:hypothetical protein
MFCKCPSRWRRGLRRRSVAARLLRLWVRIPTRGAWICVCCECCQIFTEWGWSFVQRSLTGCGVSQYDREASIMRTIWTSRGCSAMENVLQIAVRRSSNCSNTTKHSPGLLLILDRRRCSLQLSYRTSDAANIKSHYSSPTEQQTLLTSNHITALLQNIRRC